MSFAITADQIDEILNGNKYPKKEECPQCDKGYFVRDTVRKNGAWIDEGRFVIQEFDEKGRFFARKFNIKYCPFCGKKLSNRRETK